MKESKQMGMLCIGMFFTLLIGTLLAYSIVDWRIDAIQVSMQASTEGVDGEQDQKVEIQSCHAEALKNAKAYHKFKFSGLKVFEDTSDKPNDYLPVVPFLPIDFFDDEENSDKDVFDYAVCFPDYEQYFTICMREKGIPSFVE